MATWVNLLDIIYPVGSIYISNNSTSPSSIIGGTWSQISGYYLYASNTNTTGGASTATHSHNGGNLFACISPNKGGGGKTYYKTAWAESTKYISDFTISAGNLLHDTSNLNEAVAIGGTSDNATINITPKYKSIFCWVRTA